MRRKLNYQIPPSYDGKKVLHFLRGEAKLSCRMVTRLKQLEDGILLNGVKVRTIDRLHTGDRLALTLPDEKNTISGEKMPLSIVFQDEDILIINKPAGLAMHPTHNHQGDTLANAVAAYLNEQGSGAVFRAVGRLDKCTSGLVVLVLHGMAASILAGHIEKTYLALPSGYFSGNGKIEKRIYRPDPMKTLRCAGETGDEAVTLWQSLVAGNAASLVRVRPLTGRTHQIRVHFASMGAPLLGDEMYGGCRDWIDRAALHCESVRLTHPVTGKQMFFSCPMPPDMMQAAKQAGLLLDAGTPDSLPFDGYGCDPLDG